MNPALAATAFASRSRMRAVSATYDSGTRSRAGVAPVTPHARRKIDRDATIPPRRVTALRQRQPGPLVELADDARWNEPAQPRGWRLAVARRCPADTCAPPLGARNCAFFSLS